MNWYLKVLKDYAAFEGRASRSEFWYFTLFHFIALIVLVMVDGVLANLIGLPFLTILYALGTFIPSIAVFVRRLHDAGYSGWWYLLNLLIPIPLIFCFFDSQPGTNKYGANPKGV